MAAAAARGTLERALSRPLLARSGSGGSTGGRRGSSAMAAIDVAPSLQGISADSLFEVMTYLTGTDVAVVAQTCKGMRDATNDKQLWRHIYWSEFQTQFGARVSLRIRDPKAVYKTRVEERKRRIRERTRQREDYHQRVAAVPRKKAVRKFLQFWQVGMVVGCPFLCVLLLVIFASQKMDGDISWSWAEVFTPIWTMIGIFIVAVILGCIAKGFDNYRNHLSCWHGSFNDSDHPVKILFNEILNEKYRAYCYCGFLGLMWISIPVMIVLKLDGYIDVNWGVTFTPVWLSLAFTTCLPLCGGDADMEDSVGFGAGVIGSTCLLWVTLIIWAVRLDGADVPAYNVLIPMWIMDGMYALAAVCGCLITTCLMLRDGNRREVPIMWGACFMTVLAMAPLITFHIFLALADAGVLDASWSQVFTPFYVWLSYFVLLGCVGCGAGVHASYRDGYHTINVARPSNV